MCVWRHSFEINDEICAIIEIGKGLELISFLILVLICFLITKIKIL